MFNGLVGEIRWPASWPEEGGELEGPASGCAGNVDKSSRGKRTKRYTQRDRCHTRAWGYAGFMTEDFLRRHQPEQGGGFRAGQPGGGGLLGDRKRKKKRMEHETRDPETALGDEECCSTTP